MSARSRDLAALGEAMREERQRQGRTQQSVADDAGLKREYVASAERGERNPAFATLMEIAQAPGARRPLSRIVEASERRMHD